MNLSQATVTAEYFLNISELIYTRAKNQADKTAYIFLQDGENVAESITYSELAKRAQEVARYLQDKNMEGERCLILLNSSIDYIITFFGCILAGVIAVPAYPPRPNKHDDRLQSILQDSCAKIIFTHDEMLEKIKNSFVSDDVKHTYDFTSVKIARQNAPTTNILPNNVQPEAIAYLQYTSGSTGNPKGVMVSHGNLLRNVYLLKTVSEYTDQSVHINWLPLFHDFGLVNGICHPLYAGQKCIFMPPAAFTQNPMRWLKAISDYRGSVSGAPNFAYEYCVERATEEDIKSINLSTWEVALNGAEPIRPETLNAFLEKFAPAGLRNTVFCPAYGLAEATLYVSTIAHHKNHTLKCVDKAALEKNIVVNSTDDHSRTLVACGAAANGQDIVIVDPTTLQPCKDNQVGEVWVCDASIASGYWNRPKESEETFSNYLNITSDNLSINKGPFLRTGDMGFLDNQDLYIVSRLKDLIIIRGANHYPQDIEFTTENAHYALKKSSVAAFSITDDKNHERLVIVQELERQWRKNFDGKEISDAIRRQIQEKHNLEIHEIILISPASISKTTSGKIQRRLCRSEYLDNKLSVLFTWQNPMTRTNETASNEVISTININVSVTDIAQFLVTKVAQASGVAPREIDTHASFADFGLGSLAIVRISGDLEHWLKIRIQPTCAYDYPTLFGLATFLHSQVHHTITPHEHTSISNINPVNINEPLAIVGMSCRFPGANDIESFWKLLQDECCAIQSTEKRWPLNDEKIATHFAGLLDEVDKFDAELFGISPREASNMDPQQRLLLEVSWEALENAGLTLPQLSGTNTGVFIGVSTNDYDQLYDQQFYARNAYTGTGNASSICANRLSYFYDLHGPSLAIDTACSSSIVALHHACQAIRHNECESAIVGGVNLLLTREISDIFAKANMLSPDGKCKTFDESANGYVRSEGCGIVIIKPLSAAVRDGNPVLSVIHGSAINQDGRSNGLTAPNGLAQQAVVLQALRAASLSSSDIDYVEAHGTGTPLGDPIEFNALTNVMRSSPRKNACLIGSVKTNIGHLEAAAGMAGLIKVVLSLQNDFIPAHLHCNSINPLLNSAQDDVIIAAKGTAWPRTDKKRHAGISSFGFGGTNAHIIIGEPPLIATTNSVATPPAALLVFSAKTPNALHNIIQKTSRWIALNKDTNINDISYTSLIKRNHLKCRAAIVVSASDNLEEKLENIPIDIVQQPVDLCWLFSGQSSQYECMGQEMYKNSPRFAFYFNECSLITETLTGYKLEDILFATENNSSTLNNAALFKQPVFTQASIFSIEYALAKTYLEMSITPKFLLGHSIGEYVVACIADIFSVDTALKMLVYRARAIEQLQVPGGMLSLDMSLIDVMQLINIENATLDIAAINANTQIVISGTTDELDRFAIVLANREQKCERLNVTHGFHSRLLSPIAQKVSQFFATMEFKLPQLPIISSKTAQLISNEMSSADYWVEQMLAPVNFVGALTTLHNKTTSPAFLEIGAKPVLLGLLKLYDKNAIAIPSLRERKNDYEQFLRSLAALYQLNIDINFNPLFVKGNCNSVTLPNYAFERTAYWLEKNTKEYAAENHAARNILNTQFTIRKLPIASPENLYFNLSFSAADKQFVNEHKIFGNPIFPAAGYIELITKALEQEFGNLACKLNELVISTPLVIDSQANIELNIDIKSIAESPCTYRVKLYSSTNEGKSWQQHISLIASIDPHNIMLTDAFINAKKSQLQEFENTCQQFISIDYFYSQYHKQGLHYGDKFQVIQQLFTNGKTKMVAHINGVKSRSNSSFVTELVDACAQIVGGCIADADPTRLWLPFVIDEIVIYGPLSGSLKSIAHISQQTNKEVNANLVIFSAHNEPIAEIKGLRLAQVSAESFLKKSLNDISYQLAWVPANITANTHKIAPNIYLLGNNNDFNFTLTERLRSHGYHCNQSSLTTIENTSVIPQLQFKVDEKPLNLLIVNCMDYWNANLSTTENIESLFNQLVPLVQDVVAIKQTKPLTITLLTADSQFCNGDRNLSHQGLASSALSGLIKVLNAEFSEIGFKLVDISTAEPMVAQIDELIPALLYGDNDALIAIRNHQLLVQRLTNKPVPNIPKDTDITRHAWHLITGGLGDLGMSTAEWLSDHGATHLILLGRSLPSTSAQRRIDELQKAGVTVKTFSADITVIDSLKPAFEYIKNSQLSLSGIIHAAGCLRDAFFNQQDISSFSEVMRPKVWGALHLHELCQDYTLDYFVCYSSIASVFGTIAQSNYASANAFLDYFVQWRRANNMAASVVNWGPWAEYGMAAKAGVLEFAKSNGVLALNPIQGLAALDQHLKLNSESNIFVKVNWPTFIKMNNNQAIQSLITEYRHVETSGTTKISSAAPDNFLATLETINEGEQKLMLIQYIHKLTTMAMGFNSITSNEFLKDFENIVPAQLGMDSLMSIEIRNSIKRDLSVDVPVQMFVSGVSINEIIDFIINHLALNYIISAANDLSEMAEIMEELTL